MVGATGTFSALVVDDDFRVANLHADLVDSLDGFSADCVVNTLASARDALSENTFDIALVDVYLPDGSGIDFISHLRCDAIVLSAAADADSVRGAVSAGAFAYLIKPFPRSALTDRLQAYARYRGAVAGAHELGQASIDAAIDALRVAPRAEPTAHHTVTRDLVLDAIRRSEDPLSAGEVATTIGISRATAQRYLAALVSKQMVRMQLRYGSTGRPEQEYLPQ